MLKIIKILLIPLLLMSITAFFSFTGCATDGTTPAESIPEGLTQQQIEQIIADATTNYEQLNTYKFDIDMDISTEVLGGLNSGETTVNSQISAGVNRASQQMQLNMEISTEGIYPLFPQLYSEMYLLSDWVYTNLEIPGADDQWAKIPLTEEFSTMFNIDAFDQQIDMLESPSEIEYLRSEIIDGLDCYVFSITPNIEELAYWLNQQNTGLDEIELNVMAVELTSLFNQLSYICYIIKDTHIIKRVILEMDMEYTSEQMGIYTGDYDAQKLYIYMDMNLYDHDLPFSVTLPEEAANAKEINDFLSIDDLLSF